MKVSETAIPDVKIIEPNVYGDDRGYFLESWHQQKFAEAGIDETFVQDNHSYSQKGILRGLHYQLQQSQGKLVRVTQGEVFDVAVDLRESSHTFGRWVAEILSGENHKMLWVPPGFAHGFLVISSTAHFLYKCTDFYAPQYERCIIWNDPELNISWPLGEGENPLLSGKDAQGIGFSKAEYFQ